MEGNMGLRNSSMFSTFPLLLSLLLLIPIAMAKSTPTTKPGDYSSSISSVQIVFTEKPEGEDPEAFYVSILTTVLGSEEAAKKALLYSYKYAISGFAAMLTPDQVSQISKQPGVLWVIPDKQVYLGDGKLH